MILLLDSGVISTLCTSANIQSVMDCKRWYETMLARSATVVASEVSDYEVRRELLRKSKTEAIKRLDQLRNQIKFYPITHEVSVEASKIWSDSRKVGKPTANDENIDADMIIIAQSRILKQENEGQYVIIVTNNLKHFVSFAYACEWKEINF